MCKPFLLACLLLVAVSCHADDNDVENAGHQKTVESLRGQILAKNSAIKANDPIVFDSVQKIPPPANILGATHHNVYQLHIGDKKCTANVAQMGPTSTLESITCDQ